MSQEFNREVCLAHSLKGSERKNHKYIAREKVGDKYKYFYTMAEYKAYKNKDIADNQAIYNEINIGEGDRNSFWNRANPVYQINGKTVTKRRAIQEVNKELVSTIEGGKRALASAIAAENRAKSNKKFKSALSRTMADAKHEAAVAKTKVERYLVKNGVLDANKLAEQKKVSDANKMEKQLQKNYKLNKKRSQKELSKKTELETKIAKAGTNPNYYYQDLGDGMSITGKVSIGEPKEKVDRQKAINKQSFKNVIKGSGRSLPASVIDEMADIYANNPHLSKEEVFAIYYGHKMASNK